MRPLSAFTAACMSGLLASAAAAPAGPASHRETAAPKRVSVLAVGDVIPHDTVLEAARDPSAEDGHDFAPMLRDVRGIVSKASLAIVNFEATMSGDGSYSGYPSFDAPPSLASALAAAGFDVATMSNNHMFDQGLKGFESTLPLLRARGLSVAGARLPGEPRWIMREADGVKIAVIAYTYASAPDAAPKFNGFAPPAAVLPRVNYFVPGDPARPLKEFAAAAAEARAAGARLVVAYVHWGEEYEGSARERERSFAASLAEAGADAVFGAHPHVVQGAGVLQARDGRAVPVFYSMGNFLSNQRRDTVDNPSTEDGLIAIAEFDVPADGGRASLASAHAVPTWVLKTEPPALSFRIVPIAGEPSSGEAFAGIRREAAESLGRTTRALGLPFAPALPGYPLAVPPVAVLPVPFYGQTLEWPWGGDFMGNARALVADNGCVMTSTAMILSYEGIDVDPRALDRALVAAKAYLPMSFQGEALGNMGFNVSAIPSVFPRIGSVRTRTPVKDEADLEFVRAAIRAKRPALLLVMSRRGFSHAVVAVGTRGRDIVINDPLDRKARSLLGDYGRLNGAGWPLSGVVLLAAVYEPVPVAASAPLPSSAPVAASNKSGASGAAEPEAAGGQDPAATRSPAPADAAKPVNAQASASAPPRMVRLEGGSFVMGARGGQSYFAEEPPHEVRLPPFLAAVKEVTVAEFARFVEDSGYLTLPERSGGAWILSGGVFARKDGANWRAPGFAQAGDEPVACVAWEDAIAYCNWLSAREGLKPAYRRMGDEWVCDWDSGGYRLPTEAEWEFAARAGKVPKGAGDFAGSASAESSGWVLGNSESRTKAAGLKAPNANGLHDTVGGVFEWCWDFFGQEYYASSPLLSPRGPETGLTRVARGGSWASRPRNARSTQRYARPPEEAASYIGFRVFRSAGP